MVRVDDVEPSGLVSMVAGVVRANAARDPVLDRLPAGAVYRLVASDAGVSATIRIAVDEIVVGGDAGRVPADVTVRATSADLVEVAAAPLRLGLPDPLSAPGRRVVARIATGRIRIRGLLRHPLLVLRLSRLLSVV